MNLGDVADFLSGGTPKKDNPTYWNGNIPWFSASNMGLRFLRHSSMTISEEGLRAGSRIAPMGSTLLLVRGSGLFNYIPICLAEREVAFNQDVKAICPKAGVDPIFLHYWIEKLRPDLEEMLDVTGIGAGKFDTDQLKRLPFPDYNLTLQKRLGQIVESFDRKIELNRRMNETLEGMAQAIFKDWFVDFGPVRRKLAGNTDPAAIMGGLARAHELAALFPDGFGEDGLPEGWANQQIGSLVDIAGGSTPSTADKTLWEPAEHWWATPKDLSSMSDLALFSTERRISSAGLSGITSGVLPAGTVLLSSRAPIGYLAVAQVPVSINQGFIALKPNDVFGSPYLYLWCKANMDQIVANANGSTFQEISKKNFRPIKTALPLDVSIVQEFCKISQPLIDRIVLAAQENRTLAETRDYLLPKLMSGEVRVREAEKMVAAAAADAQLKLVSSNPVDFDLFGAPFLASNDNAERDAVMVAGVVKALQKDQLIIGNVKIQKGCYFAKRRANMAISNFAKKAAGPYDATLTNDGGKLEAIEKGWIIGTNRSTANGIIEGSVPGTQIKDIEPLTEYYGLKDAMDWVAKHLSSKTREELECLATVDFAMQTLRLSGVEPTLQSVKVDIARDTVWQPKLKKPHFSDDAIRKAIADLSRWFEAEGLAQ